MSCGSVSFGHRGGMGLYLQDEDEVALPHQEHVYRSLPHKSQLLRNYHHYPPGGNITYPNYSSTVSTPRNRQTNSARGSLVEAMGNIPLTQAPQDFSVASDNRSESTVVEQQRRASNSRSILSIQSGANADGDTGFLVVQGVSGPVAHMVGVDIDNHPVEVLIDEHEGATSEDNLSHDSYELIEKAGSILELNNQVQQNQPPPLVNQFEQEFYRQAAQASNKKNGMSGSSRASSHCSLSMSPQVIAKRQTDIVVVEPSPCASNTNSISRVKSQDSFSQASNHNVSLTNLNNNPQVTAAASASVAAAAVSIVDRPSPNQVGVIDVVAAAGERVDEDMTVIKEAESTRLMVDIVRANNRPSRNQLPSQIIYGERPSYASHSLPRSNADVMFHHQQQQQQQQQQQAQQQQQHVQQQQLSSRTLPSRRRERSPVYYSRSRIMPGGVVTPSGLECSSGSSSSHASPQIARPKSLDFAVVNVNSLPKKQAYAYHDDSLEHYAHQIPPQPKPRSHLSKPIDPYDDSSSAINEQLSSSDVPQTPENPNITFLPLEAGPVIVGCHQGIIRKQYYTTEERIYDVPEGIEGVSVPIKVITSQPPQMDVVTSPSSSSGITDPYVPKEVLSATQQPSSTQPSTVVVVSNAPENVSSTANNAAPTAASVASGGGPPLAPPLPPHQPVIAQHVRSNHRGLASKLEQGKFRNLVAPQDSTESADSTSMYHKHPQRPARPIRGRGSAQSHYSTTTLPPPQRALLATMSSTESESAMSARSAPTPVSNPDQLMIKQQQELEQQMLLQESLELEIHSDILVEEPLEIESPKLQVNLISPPAEESESSTAVLDSEGVPAPPPEFSGAAMVSDDDPQEATDVEDENSQSHKIDVQPPTEALESESKEETTQETAIEPEEKVDDNSDSKQSDPKDPPGIDEDDQVENQEEDEEQSSKVIKIADLYVKMEHSGSGSISEEGNTGSDIIPVPFIDENEEDLINNLDGAAAGGSNDSTQMDKIEAIVLPTEQHAEAIFIPPSPQNVSKTEEVEDEAPKVQEEDVDLTTSAAFDLDVENIPPPVAHSDLHQPSIESTSSTCSPPPPPPMLLDGSDGPPTAVFNSNTEAGSFPFPPRTLSRISEASSMNKKESDQAMMPCEQQPICSRSGSEGGPDTMTDQNCTTSDDADNNPPSLNSDLPENIVGGAGSVMRAIAEFEARQAAGQGHSQHRCDSKDLPSPPSSLINTTTEEVTQEGKTEVTLVDSLYLELSHGPANNLSQDSIEPPHDEEEDVIPEAALPIGAREKIPYDLSISSENEVTNGEEKSDDPGRARRNSEGSLHDSMEILEEVATEDHFDNDLPVDSESDDGEPKDIFEMPPMPETVNNDGGSNTPPPGGQEFIF